MKKIVGISGFKGSGKDYISSQIIKYYTPQKAKKVAFADSMKDIVYSALYKQMYEGKEITKEELYIWGDGLKNRPDISIKNHNDLNIINVREILQKFGTDFIQDTLGHKTLWVDHLAYKLGISDFKIDLNDITDKKDIIKNVLLGLNYTDDKNRYFINIDDTQYEIDFDRLCIDILENTKNLYSEDYIISDYEVAVISDVRFQHEKDFIDNNLGKTFFIYSKEGRICQYYDFLEEIKKSNISSTDLHRSETEMISFSNDCIPIINIIGTNIAGHKIIDVLVKDTVENKRKNLETKSIDFSIN